MRRWVGVDVGGSKKGFDLAALEGRRLVAHTRVREARAAARWIADQEPSLVAVDAPRTWAPPGSGARPGERELAKAGICNLFFTPDRQRGRGHPFYEWMERGHALYRALQIVGIDTIECFPTASWTRLCGARAGRRRAAWTRVGLGELGILDVPERQGQDLRDAIVAAYTAALWRGGKTELFGDIVVPRPDARV